MSGADRPEALMEALALPALERVEVGVAVLEDGPGDTPMRWLNPAFESMTGYARAELEGNSLRVLYRADRDQPGVIELLQAMRERAGCSVLMRCYHPDGSLYWCGLRMEPLVAADGRRWWLAFARDVSAEREMELLLGRRGEEIDLARRRLEEVDAVDRLTGLRNADGFELALELAWVSCARDRRALALFLFAPDQFDVYRETFGQVTGDSCLRMVARAVGGVFRRASDVSARIGDAQFAAVGVGMPAEVLEPHARQVCDRVRALAIRNPRAPRGREVTLSAAVVHARPEQASDWRALLARGREMLAAAQADGVEQVVLQLEAGDDAAGPGPAHPAS